MGEYILIIYVLLLLVLLCFIHIEIEVFKIISEAIFTNISIIIIIINLEANFKSLVHESLSDFLLSHLTSNLLQQDLYKDSARGCSVVLCQTDDVEHLMEML